MIAPDIWVQIQAAQQAAQPGSAPEMFANLGDSYRRLYLVAGGAVRDRFYAQALAAYADGIAASNTGGDANNSLVALHVGLAGLYRDRVVNVDPTMVAKYAGLMVREAAAALSLLPGDDGRRRELLQWQADGLTVLVADARHRRDWQQALTFLDRLDQLPSGLVEAKVLDAERKAIMIQQALQLMEQGNRDAALAVAGPEIAGVDLTPPAQARSLFASWQVTITADGSRIDVKAIGVPATDRYQAANRALQTVVNLWRSEPSSATAMQRDYTVTVKALDPISMTGVQSRTENIQKSSTGVTQTVAHPMIDLHIVMPSSAKGTALAEVLPPGADWALLRALLSQLGPAAEHKSRLFWQQVSLSQPMDLRGAGQEWLSMASGLERQAAAFEADSSAATASETTGAEAALTARIKAVNYRQEAEVWRGLARNSWILYTMETHEPLAAGWSRSPSVRSWYASVTSPSQVFVLQTQVVNLGWLAVFAVLSLFGMIILAGVLWWLL